MQPNTHFRANWHPPQAPCPRILVISLVCPWPGHIRLSWTAPFSLWTLNGGMLWLPKIYLVKLLLYSCSVTCCQETIPHFLWTQRNTNKLPSLQEHTKNKCNAPTETLLSSPDFKSSFLFTWEEGEQDCHKLSQSKVPQCLSIVPKKTFSTVVPNAQWRISRPNGLQSKITRYTDKQTRAQHFFSNTHILLCKIHLGEVL